jgi:hypothetical protein
MREQPTTPDPSALRQSSERTRTIESDGTNRKEQGSRGSRLQALSERGRGAMARVEAGAAGTYWSQLTAVDFINSSFAFAALAVVGAFPFLAVIPAAAGAGGVKQPVITRMGLTPKRRET